MKLRRLLLPVTALLGLGGLLFASLVQEQRGAPPLPEELEVLREKAGTWKTEATFHQINGSMTGTTTLEWKCDGRWLIGDFEGEFNITGAPVGGPFFGHQVIGWDASVGKYVSTWCDSTGSYISTSHGEWDDASQTMTWHGQSWDPQSQRLKKMKMVDVRKDEDHTEFRMYTVNADESETLDATFQYTREK